MSSSRSGIERAHATWRRLVTAGLFTAVLVAGVLPSAQSMAQPRRPDVDIEAAYYRQPQLVDRALARLEPPRPGRTELYFVSFAGFGTEAVFKREALAVQELFDERFDTTGRSLALVNHVTTLDSIPLANMTNLDLVLQHLGRLIDRNRDVLFLFVTSHGNKGLIAVDMPGFGFNTLTPERLKSVLDRSGIRNRIVVLSACHSGSFIPALADANTLVITAAHADRTSFGCDDRRQWTYFGDAYFNQALRRETSFVRAFDEAKRLIRQWERREKLPASQPQIAGGAAMRAVLAAIGHGD
jgi:hypothetical protein